MPECLNCGAHVTDQYARVFTPADVENPQACPHCEDMTRGREGARQKRT